VGLGTGLAICKDVSARKRSSYAFAALVLALGAPLGLIAIRLAVKGGPPSLGRIAAEVMADLGTFVYVTLSTSIAFATFAYALGRQADRLYEVSGKDPLTGLLNRRRLEERLEEELARARRYGSRVALLLIDLDGLKTLNDRLGHGGGDEALRRAAEAIRLGSRATDLAARWGGDEFLLVAPNTGLDEAAQLAERIRAMVAGPFDDRIPRVTVSIGVFGGTAHDGHRHLDALVAGADAALYEAKRRGRNRVAVGISEADEVASRLPRERAGGAP
jgi:diguanylate cyclase (GGDEF)-like protein